MMVDYYLGIDPGKKGGIAAIPGNRRRGNVHVISMVEDLHRVGMWLHGYSDLELDSRAIAAMEKVTASPQMGVTSAFTFGRGLGLLEGMLTACGIPLVDPELTPPKTWQKALGITPRKKHTKHRKVKNRKGNLTVKKYGGETDTQWKARLLHAAKRLYPNLDVWQEAKYKQLAVCDALLLAEYCRRKDQGLL